MKEPDGTVDGISQCFLCGAMVPFERLSDKVTNIECSNDHTPFMAEQAETLTALRAENESLKAEAKMGNIPYKEAIALRARVAELEGDCDDVSRRVFETVFNDREALRAEVEKWKESRIYHQNIVYAVCNELDTPDNKFVCSGSVAEPSTEVQDGVTALCAEVVDLTNLVEVGENNYQERLKQIGALRAEVAEKERRFQEKADEVHQLCEIAQDRDLEITTALALLLKIGCLVNHTDASNAEEELTTIQRWVTENRDAQGEGSLKVTMDEHTGLPIFGAAQGEGE